jgi:hypothetical protein
MDFQLSKKDIDIKTMSGSQYWVNITDYETVQGEYYRPWKVAVGHVVVVLYAPPQKGGEIWIPMRSSGT